MSLKGNSFTLVLFIYLLLITSHLKNTNAQGFEVENEEEFSYVVGAPDGPENWGNLNSSWTMCGIGQKQSPINIPWNSTVVPGHQSLTRNYQLAPATIKNRGHDIEVDWSGDAGSILINGTQFQVLQCHWHIPSEHTLNGVRFAMELHIVHANSQGDIAVIGILYMFGSPDHFLAQITPFLGLVDEPGEETYAGIIDPTNIWFDITKYYRYNGSLTTPPCSENVTWTIIKKVETVSMAQVIALQNAVHDESVGNARPIQPLNGRLVYLYRPRLY